MLVGNSVINIPVHTHIRFISIPVNKRLSLSRLLAGIRHMRVYLKLKPSLLIIGTHELLWPSLLLRLFTRTKIIYDVRENYYLNIRHSSAFPLPVRLLIALYVRAKEIITAPFVTHFTLAEFVYSQQLPFINERFTVIENKSARNSVRSNRKLTEPVKIIFTGTIAESTGIYEAIDFVIGLQKNNLNVNFTIIGFTALYRDLLRIKNKIAEFDFIQLVGGNQRVPHDQIIAAIKAADFGIIHYPESSHTLDRIPTKYFEYLSHQLPFFMDSTSSLFAEAIAYPACIGVDFRNPEYAQTITKIKEIKFYQMLPKATTWDSEEEKLLQLLRQLAAV
ncbi:MAG: glycosyltransferase family 4 protein [Flammeovirgaceae bacterium]|nr:glycosyltransferase family 4 protein [Flammeovirgaceae bacterium]